VWFRAVLLFIFWLLVFQVVFRVLRFLLRPSAGRGGRVPGEPPGPQPDRARPPWRPTEVIDVAFRDAPGHPAPGGGETAAESAPEAPGPAGRPRPVVPVPAPGLGVPGPLTAAVFDLDGTLIDSLPSTFVAIREAVRPWLGRDLSDREIYDLFGPADHEIVAALVPPGDGPDAVRRLMEAYERELTRVRFFEGVTEAVEGLRRRGLRLALCTGRGRRSTEFLLDRLGMSAWFEAVVTGDEVPRPKPAPDGILETLRRMDPSPRPDQVLYVGDSVKDVDAGLAAGAFTVAALWGGTEAGSAGFERAHARARRPAELAEIVAAR
jgi:HAD superfamily hydrolase (TIGR01549 family)